MSTIESQDSMNSMDYSYLSDGFVEAPTLSSKEMQHARKEALKILKSNSPQEALKIFTEGSEAKAADLARQKAQTPTMPPNRADAKKANDTVQSPPPKN